MAKKETKVDAIVFPSLDILRISMLFNNLGSAKEYIIDSDKKIKYRNTTKV